MKSVSFNLHMPHINDAYPDTIELLANDGKVTANRAFLRLASPAIHKQLMENPEIAIFDLRNHKKTTIDHLLHGIYNGKTSFTDEIEKEEVVSLAQELDINITQTSKLADEAPKVSEESEEQSKDVEPKLTRLKDGTVSCDACFKIFAGGKNAMGNAKQHYKQVHLSKDKNVNCRFQGCDKKFAHMHAMKMHMLRCHGISAKQIPSTTKTKSSTIKTKSSTSFTKLTKKAVKKEAPEKVIKEERESIED